MSIIGTALLLGVLSSAGTSMYLSNNKNAKPSTFGNRVKNFLTQPVSSKYKPKVLKKIEEAVANPEQNSVQPKTNSEKFVAGLKTGHILGTAWLSTTLIPLVLKFFSVDDDSIWMKLSKINLPFAALGGIGSLAVATFGKNDNVENSKNFIDNLARRFKFTKDKKVIDVSSGVERNDLYRSLGRLILPENIRSRVKSAMKDSTIHGTGMHAIGPPGNGKTSLAYGIASTMLEDDEENKLSAAQVWLVEPSIMEGTLADQDELGMFTKMLDGLSTSMGFGRVSGDTVTERIESIVAHAVAHYKMTGEPVVILLDEAHEIFKPKGSRNMPRFAFDDAGADSSFDTSTVDPNKRTKTINEFGKLLEDKIKKEMCTGVILLAASNIGQNEITAQMFRRMPMVTLHNPGRDEKICKMRESTEHWFTNTALKEKTKKLTDSGITLDLVSERLRELEDSSQTLIPRGSEVSLAEKSNIYDVGSVNLVDVYFNGDESEVIKAGYINFLQDMKSRDVLCFEHIDFAIRDAIHNFNGGTVDDFLRLVQKALVSYTEETLQAKDSVLGSVKYYQRVKLQGNQASSGVATAQPSELLNNPELEKLFTKWLEGKFGPITQQVSGYIEGIVKKVISQGSDTMGPHLSN